MKKIDLTLLMAAWNARSPFALLLLMQVAMVLSFATWQLLTNNFAVERAGFDGAQWGVLQSTREIPGFLAFLVVFLIMWIREQRLAYIALMMLAGAVLFTGQMPFFWGLMLSTLISSIGFHYYETVNQSLQLQWLPKATAPKQLGIIAGVASFVTFLIYLTITIGWDFFGWSFEGVYLGVGLGSLALIGLAMWRFPIFPQGEVQHTGILLRKRYWLYYVMEFLAGARRQIFVVFAGFMMVEKYGFEVEDMSLLMLTTFLAGTFIGPIIGRFVSHFGERLTLQVEYFGLAIVFGLYMVVYLYDLPAWFAAGLYLVDHILFAMRIALKTYFQKIADPKDMASTAAVSFTINHIAAVFLPVLLGLLWIISPATVFGFAMVLALCSLCAAFLIPRNPSAGHETVLAK